eukprot:114126-Rhodomonas_salina.1
MTKADEWSTGLFKMFGKKEEGFVTPGLLPSQPYAPTPTQMMSMLLPPPAMTPSVATQYAARPPPGQGYN